MTRPALAFVFNTFQVLPHASLELCLAVYNALSTSHQVVKTGAITSDRVESSPMHAQRDPDEALLPNAVTASLSIQGAR